MVYFDVVLRVNNAFVLPLVGVSRKSVDNVQIFFIVNLDFQISWLYSFLYNIFNKSLFEGKDYNLCGLKWREYIRWSLFEHANNCISSQGDSFVSKTLYFTFLKLKFSFHENNGTVYQEENNTRNISCIWGLHLEFKVSYYSSILIE